LVFLEFRHNIGVMISNMCKKNREAGLLRGEKNAPDVHSS
jgi:hypothetical protein